ncbi:MAG: SDR family oxidoreductase [Spirosomataceae bacterium]
MKLSNQTAIVTGSSSGIGRAIAVAFGREGANVVINYNSSREKALEAVKQIKAEGGKAIAVKANVSKEADVLRMFEKAVAAFGQVTVMVANSGIQDDAPFLKMTLQQWEKVIGINLTGQFLCAREAANHFVRQTEGKNSEGAIGKIICMSSVHDMIPWAGHVNYAASKGGVLMLMKSMAQELAPLKIRVNAISPGAIQTPINRSVWASETNLKELMNLIPYRRIGQPEDVAKAAVWLASDDSDYITGETLYVDGGMMLYPEFSDNG